MVNGKSGDTGKWDVEELRPPREIYVPLSMRARLLLLQAAFLVMVVLATNTVIIHTLNATPYQSEKGLPTGNDSEVRMLLQDRFDSLDDRWYVEGEVAVRDGSVILNITKSGYDRASIDDGQGDREYGWQYVNAEFELACGGGEDDAYRGWGFADMLPSHPSNSLLFVQYPSGSDESLVGFWVQVAVNNTLLHSVHIQGIDSARFHNYTILWEPGNASFLIDGKMILSTSDSPQTPMCVGALGAPWAYLAPADERGNVIMKTVIDVGRDVWIEIRELRVFASEKRLLDHAAEVALILSAAQSVMDRAQQRGLDIQQMLRDYAAVQTALSGDGYVTAPLVSGMRAVGEVLPEYLDELAELFPEARRAVEAAGDGPRASQMEGYYSQAKAAWDGYEYRRCLDRLQMIMELTQA